MAVRRIARASAAVVVGLAFFALSRPGLAQNPYLLYRPIYLAPLAGYIADPYGLHGAADVIRAQGQLMKDQQEAFLRRVEVRKARLELHRKQLEQWLWERDHLPTPEDERERVREEQHRRALHDPPPTEIWTAVSLNELLNDAVKPFSLGAQPPRIAVPQEVLAKINVTSGKSGTDVGLLKDGKLDWPLVLRRAVFTQERVEIEQGVGQATKEAIAGRASVEIIDQLSSTIDELEGKLVRLVGRTRPAQYIDAKGFLRQLDEAVRALELPGAGKLLGGNYGARGKTVAELVEYMKTNGLQFAPAHAGSESAYLALYYALRDYDAQIGTPVRKRR